MLDPPCHRVISDTLLRDGASSRLMEETLLQGPIRTTLPTPVERHAMVAKKKKKKSTKENHQRKSKKTDETVHKRVPA